MPCAPSTAASHRPLPTESARRLINILDGTEPLEACTDDLRRYVAHLLQHRSPATSAVRYRLTAAVLRPGRPRQPAPVEDLRKPLKACQGRDSRQLRDTDAHPPHARTGRHAPRRGHRVDRRQHRPGLQRHRRDRQRPKPARDPLRPPDRAGVNPLPAGPGRGTRRQRSPALGGSARWRPDRQRARSGARAPSVQPAIARVHPHQLRNTAADRWLGESGGNERPAITARKAGIADKLLAGLADHGHGTGSRTK